MVESSNTEFGQPDDPQRGRSLDRDRQGSMPIAGPEMDRHLRRAGYARRVGELSDVDVETNPPTNGQTLVWDETVGGDPNNPENNSEPTGSWVPGAGGGTVLIEVHNATGSTLTLGMPVYVSGTHASGKPEVAPAQANSTSTMPAIGLVQADIVAGAEGYVVAGGTLVGPTLDTTSYADGDPLYVDPDNAGQLVNARPSDVSPEDLVQKVALVTRVHATVGSVIVMGAGRVNDIPNALGDVTALGLTASAERLIGNAQVTDGGVEEISLDATLEFNPSGVTLGIAGKSLGTTEIADGAITDALLASGGQYHGAYNTEAETQRSGATATTEIYYTARPDGDGYAESEVTTSTPAGAVIERRLYFSDKFDADPDTSGDWTLYTTQPADDTAFATAKASLLAGLSDTDGTANTRGTLPVSLKMEHQFVTDLLLDDYPGAVAAFSVRKIRYGYSGSALRVREDSGNTEADIGFDSNGDLDTAAIATHCGSANGYVVTWYDQSGHGNDLTQSTASDQPEIYNGTSTTTVNSRSAMSFVNDRVLTASAFSTSTTATVFEVFSAPTADTYHFHYRTTTGGHALLHNNNGRLTATFVGVADYNSANNVIGNDQQALVSAVMISATSLDAYKNGSSVISTTPGTMSAPGGTFRMGAWTSDGFGLDGELQEWILYDSDESSNRTGIESNINTYFSVY